MTDKVPVQIDYTSRDYTSLVNDLTNLVNVRTNNAWTADDPNDLGTVLLESFAYMGDIMSYYIDRIANEQSIDTAARRKTLVDIGRLFGYRVSGPTPASVEVRFENVSEVALDIPIGTQVLASLLYGNYTEVYFETTEAAVQLAPGDAVTLTCVEGKTVNTDRPDLISAETNKPLPASLGVSTGLANQTYELFDSGVVDNSIVVYVGQAESFTPWTFVDTLAEFGPTSLVFTTTIDEYGVTSVIFGDGVNGAIPPVNQVISALYRVSVGISGNLAAETIEEVTFIPGNNVPEAVTYLSVSNTAASFGGADGDDSSQIRKKVKAAIVARRRAVTLKDYEDLALQVARVGKVKAVSQVYTSVTLYMQSQNDGSVTPGLVSGTPTSSWSSTAANIVSYLEEKIPVGTTVTVSQPTYVDIYLTLDVTIESSYKNSDVEKAIRRAIINPGGLLSYESVDFGKDVSYSAVIATAYSVPGVLSAIPSKLNKTNGSGANVPAVVIADGEIPILQTSNLIINVTGGK